VSATDRAPRPAATLRSLVRLPEPGSETDGFVRLNRNERLEPLPEWFLDSLRRRVESDLLTTYPVADQLYATLAASLGVEPDRLLLTPGSDAAVKAIYHAYLEPGDRVVILDPSYAMYAVYGEMFGADTIRVPFERIDGIEVERILAEIVDGVKLVMITNPNQPTGTLMSEEGLVAIVERAAAVGALVTVDEAYFPFSGTTIVARTDQAPNLAVTRSFSKAAGMAGLRLGYVAADASVIGALFKVRSVHDVNAFAMACATELLASPSIVDDYVSAVRAGASVLSERLAPCGLEVLPTSTNFALVDVSRRCSPGALIERLRDRGYLVRGPFAHAVLAPFIRVTLGPPALMAAFCDVLLDVLGQAEQVAG
jgi:histidinol-phosphate aminotransferase